MRALLMLLLFAGCAKDEAPKRTGQIISLESKNKLFTVHFPDDYTARRGEQSLIVVGTGANKQARVSFVGVGNPITNDVGELARLMMKSISDGEKEWKDLGRAPAKCHGEEGLRVEATYVDGAMPRHLTGCAFFKREHGFLFYMDVPEERRAVDEAALQKIIDATTFAE